MLLNGVTNCYVSLRKESINLRLLIPGLESFMPQSMLPDPWETLPRFSQKSSLFAEEKNPLLIERDDFYSDISGKIGESCFLPTVNTWSFRSAPALLETVTDDAIA